MIYIVTDSYGKAVAASPEYMTAYKIAVRLCGGEAAVSHVVAVPCVVEGGVE